MDDIPDPDLRKLRCLVAVSEYGSFTKAARQLGVAQPALSRIVRQLEESLGAQLFRRNGRGVLPTEVGADVLDHVKAILEQVDRLKELMRGWQDTPAGTVLLGVPHSVSMILIEPLFDRIRRSFPGIRLNVSEAFSGDLAEWLSIGRLDIAVLYDPGQNTNLVYRKLLVEDMFLCTSGSETGDDRTITMHEAMRQPLVLPSRPHGLRLLVEAATRAEGLTPDVVLELNAMATIRSLVARGGVGTILPFGAVYREVETGQLSARRIVSPSITRSLVIAETTRRSRTRATDMVVKCIEEETQLLVAQGNWLGPIT